MKADNWLKFLVLTIVLAAGLASSSGIFSGGGSGAYLYTSIRGHEVKIYGKGLYRDMSAEVAPQGIAQDYVTLFIAIPMLLISWYIQRWSPMRGRYLLAGTLVYFLVTYLFYLVMAMYNVMFIIYVIALCASFYGFLLSLRKLAAMEPLRHFSPATPARFAGGFLVVNSVLIGILWLGVILPPLTDGTIIPAQAEHYTTLIVQGLDLAILLPGGLMSGILFYRKKREGYLFAPLYLVFLSLLMTALSAKVIAMAMLGYNVIPVIFLIPSINVLSIICTYLVIKRINENAEEAH